jgi:hypothetical protein
VILLGGELGFPLGIGFLYAAWCRSRMAGQMDNVFPGLHIRLVLAG